MEAQMRKCRLETDGKISGCKGKKQIKNRSSQIETCLTTNQATNQP